MGDCGTIITKCLSLYPLLLAQMQEPVGEPHYREERAETEQERAKAKGIVREGLLRLEGMDGHLQGHKKPHTI